MMKCYRWNSMTTSLLGLIALSTVVSGFTPRVSLLPSQVSSTQINSVEYWISGVTNSPPSKPLLTEALKSTLTMRTSLQDKDLACVYKASKDGWSAIDFHRCVDEKGSALVVALSRSGQCFGGFNPLGWRSTDDYYQSNAAFLWYANNGKSATRCPILVGGNAAVFDYATAGPCFGAADLIIGEPKAAVMGGFAGPDMMDSSIGAGNLRSGRSSIGGSYSFANNNWPIRGEFNLVELEVYCNSAINLPSRSGPNWWPF